MCYSQPLTNDILTEHTYFLALQQYCLQQQSLNAYPKACSLRITSLSMPGNFFFCLFFYWAASHLCSLRTSVLASSVANSWQFITDFKVGKLLLKPQVSWGKMDATISKKVFFIFMAAGKSMKTYLF